MAEAVANYSQPQMESVTLTLSADEAHLFTQFIRETHVGLVASLLPDERTAKHRDINEVLYQIYHVLYPLCGGG